MEIDIERFDLLEYIRKIHNKLSRSPLSEIGESLRERYGDAKWLNDPDYNFLMALCWIARTEKVQWALWDRVRPVFQSKYNGDVRNIETEADCAELGYPKKLVPYRWLPNLSKFLKRKEKSFKDFLQGRRDKTGIEIRDELTFILGIQNEAKRVSVFIRDWLQKDVFPIDTNVRYVLKSLGLPEDEEMLVHLCRRAEIDPKRLERLLYRHGRQICGKGESCSLEGICLSSIFNLDRCEK